MKNYQYEKGNARKMEEILVSIVTPVFNGEKTIARTIESVLNQTYTRLEYRIIDGLSSDNTVKIAQEYSEEFKKRGIDYKIVSEKDTGIYNAMNKGVSLSSGTIIGIINSDDWYESNAVEKAVEAYQKTSYDVMYASIRVHLPDRAYIKKSRIRNYMTTRDWNHPTTFIANEVYQQFQYVEESLYDDWDLILKLKKNHKKFMVIDDVLANFSVGGSSYYSNIKKVIEMANTRYRIYRENGFGYKYVFECYLMEIGKFLLR